MNLPAKEILEISNKVNSTILKLEELYNELWPVGGHQDDQWDSAAMYLEDFANILEQLFGRRPVDENGYYIPKVDRTDILLERLQELEAQNANA